MNTPKPKELTKEEREALDRFMATLEPRSALDDDVCWLEDDGAVWGSTLYAYILHLEAQRRAALRAGLDSGRRGTQRQQEELRQADRVVVVTDSLHRSRRRTGSE